MPDEGVPEPKPGEEKQGADWTTDETAGQTAKDADGMTQNTHSPPVNNTESKEDQTDDGAEPKDSPDPAPSPLHRNKFANTYNGNFSPFLGRNPPSRAAWFKAFSKSAYKWHKVIPDTELQVAIKMIRRAKDAFRNRYTGWRATLQHEPPVSVTVLKIEAYDLPAMDLGGTSDPYCRLKIDSGICQTTLQVIAGPEGAYFGARHVSDRRADPNPEPSVGHGFDLHCQVLHQSLDCLGERRPLPSVRVTKCRSMGIAT